MTSKANSRSIAGVGAVIVAAGSSTRMLGVDKIFSPLGGYPLVLWTIQAFERCASVDSIVLVVSEGQSLWEAARLINEQEHWQKIRAIKAGGRRRQDSVALGVASLPPCEWVVVHDGARPLVSPTLIERGLEAAQATGAAIAAVPTRDTLKVVGPNGDIKSTPDRESLWIGQTPQIFRREILEKAHREIVDDVTDDAAMVERLNVNVRVYWGSNDNLKVTTPEDLIVAEALLESSAREST